MARGIMLMSCVGIAPSLLAPVCSSSTKNIAKGTACHQLGVFVLDLLAILVMCAYIPAVLVLKPFHFFDDSDLDKKVSLTVFFICSLIFISIQWWENFIDDRFCGPTKRQGSWKLFILGVKFDLQESRPVISFFMGIWKICLTALFSWLYRSYLPINVYDEGAEERDISDVSLGEIFDKLGDMPLYLNAAILTLTLAAFVGNYAATIACKLQMQVFSFSLPLLLSVPVSVIIVVLDCSGYDLLEPFTGEKRACFDEDKYTTDDDEQYWFHYIYGVAIWAALYWIGRYIFYPTTERLAKVER